ncbi:hypothetical protein SLA2020_068570 [Shorea laevis]
MQNFITFYVEMEKAKLGDKGGGAGGAEDDAPKPETGGRCGRERHEFIMDDAADLLRGILFFLYLRQAFKKSGFALFPQHQQKSYIIPTTHLEKLRWIKGNLQKLEIRMI